MKKKKLSKDQPSNLPPKERRIAETLESRLTVNVSDGQIGFRLNLRDICGEQTDVFEGLENVPKNKVN